jgi:phosphatidylserine/phosphatidylglycerophosphate/cardiolipin synthase-like enzyme
MRLSSRECNVNELWQVIAELCLELHPDRIEAIASKISSLASVARFEQVKTSFGPNADLRLFECLYRAWRNTPGIGSAELAAALRSTSAAANLYESRSSIELVWTGPSTEMVPVRNTERVLCEIVAAAKTRIFIVSYVAYEVDSVVQALQNAAARNVRIDMLLESSIEHGGSVTVDSVKTMERSIPSVHIYAWKPEGIGGSVHAKCAVADGNVALITSANLSPAAMERNMELGVLVKGGHLPANLLRHLDALVTTGTVEPL